MRDRRVIPSEIFGKITRSIAQTIVVYEQGRKNLLGPKNTSSSQRAKPKIKKQVGKKIRKIAAANATSVALEEKQIRGSERERTNVV